MQRIKEQLIIQYQRYTSTFYGKIGAFCLYYSVYHAVPIILTNIIPFLLTYLQQKHIFIIILITLMIVVALVWNVAMMVVYKLKIPFFEQYRVNPDKLWPWEQNYQKWISLLKRSILFTAISLLVLSPLLLLFKINYMHFQVIMDMQKLPTFLQILPQLIIMMLIEDLVFFWSHWAFHHPLLYKYHKIHHQYTISVSTAGLHFHCLQFFIGQMVSADLYMRGAMLFGPLHINTLVFWYIFRMWDAHSGHCGYIFPWTPLQLLPFCTQDEFHDFHHTRNFGNYGSHFRFWDSLFGTNKAFREYKQKQKMLKKVN